MATSAPVGAAIYGITDGSTAPTFGDTTGSLVDMVGYGIGGNSAGSFASGTRRYARNRLYGVLSGRVDHPLLTSQDLSSASEPGGSGTYNKGIYYGLHTTLFDTVTRDWTNAAFGVVATPEPSTYLVFGSGLAALAFFRRRR